MKNAFDVIVVGAGVVGCALARRFALSGMSIAVIDRAYDVGEGGASKSNSAIVHTGFDCEPGSLESTLVTKASRQWPTLAQELKIPFERTGALMLARNAQDLLACEKYLKLARENKVEDCRMLSASECREMEPMVFNNVFGGLYIPREAVVDPFATCHAFADIAHATGNCKFMLGMEVSKITKDSGFLVCHTDNKRVFGRCVINSAGLGTQHLHAKSFPDSNFKFQVNPRRGQFLVYDKPARKLVNHILLPVPGAGGKGMLVAPTVFGSLICGPTAEDLPSDDSSASTQTTAQGLALVKQSVLQMVPALSKYSPIAQYAGARANCAQGNYLFDFNTQDCVVTLAGIRSTGLSASFSIADYVYEEMARLNMFEKTLKQVVACPGRSQYPPWYNAKKQPNLHHRNELVCYCEQVTKADITQALQQANCPATTDAVKRRTRATMGTCQGFACLPAVCKQISSERKIKVKQVCKSGEQGTEWFPTFVDSLPAKPILPTRIYPLLLQTEEEIDHFQTIVIGSGPSGCGVLEGLSKYAVMDKMLLLEQSSRIGGIPARYAPTSSRTFLTLHGMDTGWAFAQRFTRQVLNSPKIQVRTQVKVTGVSLAANCDALLQVTTHTGHRFLADHVVVATGARESAAVECNPPVTGHRAARILFSNNLLETGGVQGSNRVYSFDNRAAGEHRVLVHSDSKQLEIDGNVYDFVVLNGNLVANQEILTNSGFQQEVKNLLLTGNCTKTNWPALACFLHGKHITTRKIIASMYF